MKYHLPTNRPCNFCNMRDHYHKTKKKTNQTTKKDPTKKKPQPNKKILNTLGKFAGTFFATICCNAI